MSAHGDSPIENALTPLVATPNDEASVSQIVVFILFKLLVRKVASRGLGDDVFHLRHSLANVHLTEIDKLNVTFTPQNIDSKQRPSDSRKAIQWRCSGPSQTLGTESSLSQSLLDPLILRVQAKHRTECNHLPEVKDEELCWICGTIQ